MSTPTEALTATLARRDADELAAQLAAALAPLIAERDALRAQRDAAVEALASISLSGNDNTAPAHVVLAGVVKRARAALLLARGTP